MPSTTTYAQSYGVFVEFASGSFTNITDWIQQISVFRSAAGMFRDFQSGELTLVLDNNDGRFSPANSAGAYNPNLKINKACYVEGSYANSVHRLFTGKIQEISVQPTLRAEHKATIICRDSLMDILDRTITTTVFSDYRVGSVVAAVFDEIGINSYSIDTLTDELPYASFDGITAGTALQRLVETGAFNFYVDANGISRFRTRHWDQEGFATVQESYGNNLFDITYMLGEEGLINEASVRGIPRATVSVNSPVAYINLAIPIPASGAVGFFLDYLDPDNLEPAPAVNLITPVVGSDCLINAAADGTGANLSSTASVSVGFFGQSAVSTIFNGTGTAGFVTRYQIRGDIIRRFPAIGGEHKDSSSQALYSERSFELTSEFLATQAYLESYAKYLVSRHKEPKGQVPISLKNQFPDVLQRDLGDVVNVQNTNLGIGGKFVVIGTEHTILADDAGWEHELRLEIEETRDEELFFLDVDTLDGDKKLSF